MRSDMIGKRIRSLSILLIAMLSIVSLCLPASALLPEEERALITLKSYYTYSIEGDIDNYLAVQDPLFLKELSNEGEIDLKEFYEFAFTEVKTSDLSITDVDVVLQEDSALVYYHLKGKFETKDGEKGTIDNDMVAFLWKYDEWKVRWTITRTLYEQKIAMTYLMDAVVETTLEGLNDEPIKAELLAEGFDLGIENYEMDEGKSSSGLLSKVFILAIIIGIIVFAVFYAKRSGRGPDAKKKSMEEDHTDDDKKDGHHKDKHQNKAGKKGKKHLSG